MSENQPEYVEPTDPEQELPRPKTTDAGDGDLNPGPDEGRDPFHDIDGDAKSN